MISFFLQSEAKFFYIRADMHLNLYRTVHCPLKALVPKQACKQGFVKRKGSA